jgi:hypothetical protein
MSRTSAETEVSTMQFAIAIFTIGAVLVLIGLVGGDLSYRGLTVPKVGPLPRFTTTITGGVFLAFSLAVFLVAEFGHDPVPDPGTPPMAGAGVISETTAASLGVEAVTVQFNDRLTEGALQEQIEVTVDGAHAGTLYADLGAPDDSIQFSVAEGTHSYTMAGALQAADGSEYPLAGEGTFDAGPGSTFDLMVSDSGELALSRST